MYVGMERGLEDILKSNVHLVDVYYAADYMAITGLIPTLISEINQLPVTHDNVEQLSQYANAFANVDILVKIAYFFRNNEGQMQNWISSLATSNVALLIGELAKCV